MRSNLGNGPDLENIGEYASKYLLRILKDGQIVGVSSGTTLLSVAEQIPANLNYSSTTFVPIVGGMGDERVDIHANVLVSMFAEKLKANYKLLHAPVMADSKKDKELFMTQTSIQSIFNLAEKADIILVGIGGSPKHSTITRSELGKSIDNILMNSMLLAIFAISLSMKTEAPLQIFGMIKSFLLILKN